MNRIRSNEAKREAARVLRELKSGSISLEGLEAALRRDGYRIMPYNPAKTAVQALAAELGVEDIVSREQSVTFRQGDIRLVLLTDRLDNEEKRLVLAHELGHVRMHHMEGTSADSPVEEYEANEFAHYLLNPSWMLRLECTVRAHARAFLAGLAMVVLLTGGTLLYAYKRQQASYFGEYYVTRTGTKYHMRDCAAVQGRELRRLRVDEAERYAPCSICITKGED